jgi:hypothetical protein
VEFAAAAAAAVAAFAGVPHVKIRKFVSYDTYPYLWIRKVEEDTWGFHMHHG